MKKYWEMHNDKLRDSVCCVCRLFAIGQNAYRVFNCENCHYNAHSDCLDYVAHRWDTGLAWGIYYLCPNCNEAQGL